jgi:hypothetical protein
LKKEFLRADAERRSHQCQHDQGCKDFPEDPPSLPASLALLTGCPDI